MAFSRTGKSWKNATDPGKFWNSVKLGKNMKCMEGSKENWHWDLGSVGVYVNFRTLEKSIRVLEKSWKFVSEKAYKPWVLSQWQYWVLLNNITQWALQSLKLGMPLYQTPVCSLLAGHAHYNHYCYHSVKLCKFKQIKISVTQFNLNLILNCHK